MNDSYFDKRRIQHFASTVYQDIEKLEILRRRSDRFTVRYATDTEDSVIVKFWNRRGLKSRTREWLGMSPAAHEWSNLVRLSGSPVSVPTPLGYGHLSSLPYTEVLILEDLGPCIRAAMYMKSFINRSDEQRLSSLEERCVALTEQMIRNKRILDKDHILSNVVINEAGDLFRLDLENARSVISCDLAVDLFAQTLGSFILSYVYMLQGTQQRNTERTPYFVERLYDKIKPPKRVREQAKEIVERRLGTQNERHGIETIINW